MLYCLFYCLFCVCFVLVHCSGVLPNQKDIGTELFAGMEDYINAPISGGAAIIITVPPSNTDINSMDYMWFGVIWCAVMHVQFWTKGSVTLLKEISFIVKHTHLLSLIWLNISKYT